MFRRILPVAVIVSLIGAICPAPALALSTQAEIEMGRISDQQIVESSVIETDPLLNAYVQSVTRNIWKEVARKDVPYNVKIIKDTQVNAFSTLGGYVYVNEGLIDFVNSDDELAGVLAHETGHIERRHVVTMQSKAEALNLLFGIASLFSPLIYNFGNLMEAGAIAKMQRADELQADRTGLQLMSRAGYDPYAMETMLDHLKALGDSHNDLVTKYLQDHPGEDARVSHLVGYPELDPKKVTEEQEIVQAASDAERARYSFSMWKFDQILKTDPTNTEALLGEGEDEIAMGLPSKSEQTLAEAAQKGNAQTRDLANAKIARLREMQAQHFTLLKPNVQGLRAQLAAAQASQSQVNAQVQARHDEARDQLKQMNARLNSLQAEVPDFSRINVQHGSRLEAVLKNVNAMGRSLNSAISDASTSINGVGSLEKNKESGLLREGNQILNEMQATLNATPIPADSIANLPFYPNVFRSLQSADADMLRTVDAGRASLTLLDQSLGDVDAFFKELAHAPIDYKGDISNSEYDALVPLMQRAMTGLNQAASAASQADQVFNMARTRQLSARITLLGLGTSPQRYATLQYALDQRFKSPGIGYRDMLRDNLTPGDVVVATILAADIKSTPQEIVDEMMRTHKSPVDLADEHGMHAWPLEIFTGLVYLDYTDDPVKEMQSN
jgi:Zn-dependent protease with chaperone function